VHEPSLLLDLAKPDIIIGCETWLKPEIHICDVMILVLQVYTTVIIYMFAVT
jgi:hypothetical protein